MANTKGEKELRRTWPIEEGLEARTTKQEGRTMNLIPTKGSLYPRRLKKGFE